jgi:hypothetical protein
MLILLAFRFGHNAGFKYLVDTFTRLFYIYFPTITPPRLLPSSSSHQYLSFISPALDRLTCDPPFVHGRLRVSRYMLSLGLLLTVGMVPIFFSLWYIYTFSLSACALSLPIFLFSARPLFCYILVP